MRPAHRHQLGQGRGAHLALGHRSVRLEQRIVQPRHTRQQRRIRCRDTFHGQSVESRHHVIPALGQPVEPRLLSTAHIGQHGHGRPAKATLGEETRDLAGRLRAGGQDQQPRVRLDEGDHLLDRTAMHRQRLQIRHRPAHPRRRQLESGQLRMIDDLTRRERPPDPRAHREPQRITRRQHDDAPPPQPFKVRDQSVEGRRPGQPFGGDAVRQNVVPVAADDDICGLDDRAGGRQQPVHAVLADPDDMQPGVRHGALLH